MEMSLLTYVLVSAHYNRIYVASVFHFKAIGGGSGVIFSCQAQIKVLIAGMSTLFTECQN